MLLKVLKLVSGNEVSNGDKNLNYSIKHNNTGLSYVKDQQRMKAESSGGGGNDLSQIN